MKRSEFVQECTKSWPHYPDTPSMRKFFNVIADAIGLKDGPGDDVTASEVPSWAEVAPRCGTFQEIGGISPGGHMVFVEHNGGMYEVFLNGCSVLVFSVPSEAAEFAVELRNALSRVPVSDAEKRAEAAELRVKELESELAKRPVHRVEVVGGPNSWCVNLNGNRVSGYYFSKEPVDQLANELRATIAAGPDASKELKELREKVKSLESKLPKIEVMRRTPWFTVMINGNPYQNCSSEFSALENCKLLRRFLGVE